MSRKNTFLPLIQYRNQRKKQELKNSLQSINQNSTLRSVKKYQSIFDDDSFKFAKLMERKDQEAASLIRKYFQKFEAKKQKQKKREYDNQKNSKQINLINLSQSLDLKIKSKPKMIKISRLSKSIDIQKYKQDTQRIFRPKKQKLRSLTQQQYSKNSNLNQLPIKILDDPFNSREQLLSRYGILKTEVSKSLENDLKVHHYDSRKSKNSYLQKIRGRSSDSKLNIYYQQGKYPIQDYGSDFKSLKKSFNVKSQNLQKSEKIKIKYKGQRKKASNDSFYANKNLKQTLNDINPWINDKYQLELRDTMR